MKRTENVTKVYDHFYRYQEITDILQDYAEKYPQLASVESSAVTPMPLSQSTTSRQQSLSITILYIKTLSILFD